MFYQRARRGFASAGKRIALVVVGCVVLGCIAGGLRAATVYTWNGTTDSTFATASNWLGGLAATTGGTFNARISVQNGAANQLIYTAAQGTTIYNSDQRALFIASGANGAMTITGGVFESQAANPDGMANGSTGSLTINGGSYINTAGAGAKTFEVVFSGGGTGTLNIQSGAFSVTTLQFGDAAASTGTGIVNLTGGTLTIQTITDLGTAVSNFNFNGGTLKALGAGAVMNAMNAATVQAGGAVVDTNTFTMTIAASLLNGGGGGGLTKNSAGTLILTGANAYTGTTLINAGTLQIGAGAAAGTLGTGGVTNNGTLTFNRSDAIAVSNAISGSGAVVQAGGGTTTLSAANTYGGSTTVSGGTLALGVNNALPSTTTLSLTGGSFSGGGFSNTVASLTMTGGGAFNSGAGAITVTGATTITNGIFNVNSNGGSVTTNSLSLGPGAVNIGNSSATTQTLTIGAGGLSLTGSSILIGNGAGVAGATAKLALNGNVTSSGTSSFSTAATAGTVLVDLGGGTRDVNVTGGTFTSDVSIQNGNLSKSGPGAMVLTETNTYANTTISGGSLTIGNGGTTGTLGTGTVTNNGALSFNRTDPITVNNVISGTGSVSQIGVGGTLILGGANS